MAKYQNNKIGILGGSFDPAHKGHLAITRISIKKLKLNKIYWVVAKKNPFKKNTVYSLNKRMSQAKKIIKNNRKIKIVYLEDIVKSSRSIDAIKYILRKDKPKNLYFIVGSDILLELHKWKSWKKIVKLAKLIVFSRKGYDKKSTKTIVAKHLNNKINFIRIRPIQISSTILRKKSMSY